MDVVKTIEDSAGSKKSSEAKLKKAYQKLSKTEHLDSILEGCRSNEDGQAQKVTMVD